MKNIFRLILLLSACSAIFMACDKNEQPVGDGKNTGEVNNAAIERVIYYTVDDRENLRTLKTESEWDEMLDQLCDQARSGSEITFYNSNRPTCIKSCQKSAATDDNTISTTSREEMKKWMKEMEKQGLTVCVSYDENSGTWHGKAYATAPAKNTLGNIVGTWNFKFLVCSLFDYDGNLQQSDLYEPEEGGGSMYYTFSADGTLTLEIHGMDSTTATDKSKWTLSDDGVLSSELLPGGTSWNVSWTTPGTMILSRSVRGTEEGDYYYQLHFESVVNNR